MDWIVCLDSSEDPRFGVLYDTDKISANDGDIAISYLTYEILKSVQNPFCIDIGADECWWAMFCCEQNPTCRIEAFEPKEQNPNFLRALHEKYPHIRLHQKAVSNKNGTLCLTIDGATSNSRDETKGQQVECTTLDFLLREKDCIDLIKIDTEGHELQILETLLPYSQKIKSIIFEFSVFWYGTSFEDSVEKTYAIMQPILAEFPYVYFLSRRNKPFLVRLKLDTFRSFIEKCLAHTYQYDLFISKIPFESTILSVQ
jgi:FkbM family methyltransferase